MTEHNHRRGKRSNDDIRHESLWSGGVSVQQISPDGEIINATGGGYHDYTCGKHGAARDRAGAKKFVHSRRRRHTRDWLNKKEYNDE